MVRFNALLVAIFTALVAPAVAWAQENDSVQEANSAAPVTIESTTTSSETLPATAVSQDSPPSLVSDQSAAPADIAPPSTTPVVILTTDLGRSIFFLLCDLPLNFQLQVRLSDRYGLALHGGAYLDLDSVDRQPGSGGVVGLGLRRSLGKNGLEKGFLGLKTQVSWYELQPTATGDDKFDFGYQITGSRLRFWYLDLHIGRTLYWNGLVLQMAAGPGLMVTLKDEPVRQVEGRSYHSLWPWSAMVVAHFELSVGFGIPAKVKAAQP